MKPTSCDHDAWHEACRFCGRCVIYPDGARYRSGRVAHIECIHLRALARVGVEA